MEKTNFKKKRTMRVVIFFLQFFSKVFGILGPQLSESGLSIDLIDFKKYEKMPQIFFTKFSLESSFKNTEFRYMKETARSELSSCTWFIEKYRNYEEQQEQFLWKNSLLEKMLHFFSFL